MASTYIKLSTNLGEDKQREISSEAENHFDAVIETLGKLNEATNEILGDYINSQKKQERIVAGNGPEQKRQRSNE